jgi:HAD superfamily hydrolase (TIGR01450 family)
VPRASGQYKFRSSAKEDVFLISLPQQIRGLLVDLDGTVYLGEKVLPGAREFLDRIRRAGKRVLFLSNNSSKSREEYLEKLGRMGLSVKGEEVFTSTAAAVVYLGREHPDAGVFPLGTPSFEKELAGEGVRLVPEDPDVVLLGFDKTLTYAKIEKAYRFLAGGSAYVATHPDVLCPTEDGFLPDAGCFIALFREATGRTPVVVGKPSAEMVRCALDVLDLGAGEVAMVGDRLYTDMKMARDTGLASVLVLSGETKSPDLEGLSDRPDFVCRGVGEIRFAGGE